MDQRFRRDRISEQRREKMKPQDPSTVSVDTTSSRVDGFSAMYSLMSMHQFRVGVGFEHAHQKLRYPIPAQVEYNRMNSTVQG